MKSNLIRYSVLLLTLIAALPEIVGAKELVRVDESKARILATTYLESHGTSPSDFSLKLEPFGKSTWMIKSYPLGIKPSLPSRYVMNSRGEIWPLNIDSLTVVLRNEFFLTNTKEDRNPLMTQFVQLHSGERVIVLRSTSDIPGYASKPLDPDLADAIRAPFQVNGFIEVLYTYQQIGGLVTRYRFTFDAQSVFTNAESAIVGKAIGAANYYE